jgi:hypothetical protein
MILILKQIFNILSLDRVTTDEVWTGVRIYWTRTEGKLQITTTVLLSYTLHRTLLSLLSIS